MRKLLALVATVAMVLGMFSGVAFAEDPEHKIVLDETIYYVTGDDDDVVKITGEVVTDDEDENPVQNIRVELVQDETEVIFDIDRTDKNGQFTLTLPGDAVIGVYTVRVGDVEVEIYVVPQLTTDDEMKLTWDELQADDFVFQFAGRLAFVPVEYTHTHVVLKGSAVKADGGIEFSVARNGRFFVFVEADQFAKPGDLKLYLSGEGDDDDELLLATGKIAAASIAVKLDTDAIVYDLPQTLVAEIDLSKAFLPEGANWEVTGAIRTSNGKALAEELNAKVDVDVTPLSGSKYKVTFEFEGLERTDAGNYQVLIQAFLDEDGPAYYAGTAAFSVVRPTTGKLYGMPTSITVAKGLNLTFDEDHIYVLYREAGVYKVAEYYEVSCEGVVEKDWQDIDPGYTTFTAAPKKAGTITVTVKAYDDQKKLIGTYTADVKVTGGFITADPDTVEVGYKGTATFTVVDENEDPVNNAFIYLVGDIETLVVNPTKVNIRDGKYTVNFANASNRGLVNKPVSYKVVAKQDGKEIAAGKFTVIGQNIYNVELNTEAVLAGEGARLVATVTDKDGDIVFPTKVKITYSDSSKYNKPAGTLTRVDTDGDGVRDSVRFDLPKAKADLGRCVYSNR